MFLLLKTNVLFYLRNVIRLKLLPLLIDGENFGAPEKGNLFHRRKVERDKEKGKKGLDPWDGEKREGIFGENWKAARSSLQIISEGVAP